MKRVRALISFNALGIIASAGQELEIPRLLALDLERLWIVEPIQKIET